MTSILLSTSMGGKRDAEASMSWPPTKKKKRDQTAKSRESSMFLSGEREKVRELPRKKKREGRLTLPRTSLTPWLNTGCQGQGRMSRFLSLTKSGVEREGKREEGVFAQTSSLDEGRQRRGHPSCQPHVP